MYYNSAVIEDKVQLEGLKKTKKNIFDKHLQKILIKLVNVDMDMFYKLFETQNSLTCTNAKILATHIGESRTHH